jgi:cytochrome c-type biogenesis protein CcmF
MPGLGRACLILALGIAVYGIAASIYGARTRNERWIISGRRSVYALFGVTAIAFAVLESAFLRSDFTFEVVGSHSSTTTPAFYRATAVWSSQEGSLLLWLLLLSLWSSVVLLVARNKLRQVTPYAQSILLGFGGFFAFLMLFMADPFAVASPVPVEGVGLNPLLRHPSMMIHPPMLYSGYTLFAIPFAFAVGALIVRKLDAEWIQATRRFALAAWFFLGVGILLGARWSYSELGWGGYWAWDPVENASLMPWLTGTAFLHSAMIQERRGMLKVWNVSLVLATGTLAVLGTFLVRSGILESIHAFGASTLGVPFLILICTMIIGSVYLVVTRRDGLRSEHRLDSLFSRESVFLINNLLLVGLCFVVFWGTFFPLISEAITGEEASVGPPWFNRYTVPLALLLVLAAGIGPLLAWRRVSLAAMRRAFAFPAAIALVTLIALLVFADVTSSITSLIMFVLGAFVLAGVAQEFWRGTRARRAMSGEPVPIALVSIVRRNRRRYGGYLVHVGIVVLLLGVAASSAFQDASDVRLTSGQTASVNGYDFRYVTPTADVGNERIALGAVVEVTKDGKQVTTLTPDRGYYPSQDISLGPIGRYFGGEATSEVGLKAGIFRDIWVAMQPDLQPLMKVIDEANRRFGESRPDVQAIAIAAIAGRWRADPPPATFRIIVSPLVTWIWIGGLIVVVGSLIALWPAPASARRRVSAAYAARLARDLGRA